MTDIPNGTKFWLTITDEIDDGEWTGPYFDNVYNNLEEAQARAKSNTSIPYQKCTVKAGIVKNGKLIAADY